MKKPYPLTLTGNSVDLVPLSAEHLGALCEVGLDESIWKWIPYAVRSVDEMRDYIAAALRARADGSAIPFAILERNSGKAIGSTRYMSIDVPNNRLEIGATWIGTKWQRTRVNTEMKYLMLRHAFEELGCTRVELKTDALNEKSRNAILRIGAKEEGTLRKHVVTYSGRIRDTVYYSILDTEWPQVRSDLGMKLSRA